MKRFAPALIKVIASLMIGLSFALAFAFPYFSDEKYKLLDKFALVAVPAFGFPMSKKK
jgi:hypothetical protein